MSTTDPPGGGGVPRTPSRNKGAGIFGIDINALEARMRADPHLFITPGRASTELRSGGCEESPRKADRVAGRFDPLHTGPSRSRRPVVHDEPEQEPATRAGTLDPAGPLLLTPEDQLEVGTEEEIVPDSQEAIGPGEGVGGDAFSVEPNPWVGEVRPPSPVTEVRPLSPLVQVKEEEFTPPPMRDGTPDFSESSSSTGSVTPTPKPRELPVSTGSSVDPDGGLSDLGYIDAQPVPRTGHIEEALRHPEPASILVLEDAHVNHVLSAIANTDHRDMKASGAWSRRVSQLIEMIAHSYRAIPNDIMGEFLDQTRTTAQKDVKELSQWFFGDASANTVGCYTCCNFHEKDHVGCAGCESHIRWGNRLEEDRDLWRAEAMSLKSKLHESETRAAAQKSESSDMAKVMESLQQLHATVGGLSTGLVGLEKSTRSQFSRIENRLNEKSEKSAAPPQAARDESRKIQPGGMSGGVTADEASSGTCDIPS
jgi:hypothetical protein